ncbi:4-alpha-glucanotransferase [Mycobacterium genavense]|uniref:4-alpha-glucanotransferase n=1 Tax=Mycobacterium genavense TaxID=36812 RepID=UPI00046F81C3|nr:4-alpha-glucanotransferase [Mycobacterium genavense]
MPEDLRRLAKAHGVATFYRNERREAVEVDADVVIRVLALLEVDAATEADRRRELAKLAEQASAGALAPTIAMRANGRPHPVPGAVALVGEDGSQTDVRDAVPGDVPPGFYRLHTGDGQEITLVVAPPQVPQTPVTWGWVLQLYALRSQRSWGISDLADLREFIGWTATAHSAGAVLVNPLHAPGPTHPVQPSPYTPVQPPIRQPARPSHRIEDLDAYHRADQQTRTEVDALRVAPDTERIDHDLVWAAKRAALELLWRAEGRPNPLDELPVSTGLRDWATYCALAERHGGRWSRWPQPLRDVAGPAVTAARDELTPRIAFHSWVQLRCSEQLGAVRDAARQAGMALGVLHDLPVGVDADGADAWALADMLATGVHVGAPPDNFTPRGQDWGLPPWRPDRLAATGYAALRDMLRAVLRHSDGLRIDHVAGLWRLWWIPPGDSPDRGTYVHYDADVMLAVLALEAQRAGAIVIGEDLGTVEPEVTAALGDHGMLGCAVSWFTRDQSVPEQPLLPPSRWPSRAAASVSTHDLPTAAGFFRGEHVRVRAKLGLLDDVLAEEASARNEKAEWSALLQSEGFLVGEPDEAAFSAAMHRFLAATPSRLKLISPYDILAERRQPNLPGTIDEYPNWRLPLPETLEQLRADPQVGEIVALFKAAPESRPGAQSSGL